MGSYRRCHNQRRFVIPTTSCDGRHLNRTFRDTSSLVQQSYGLGARVNHPLRRYEPPLRQLVWALRGEKAWLCRNVSTWKYKDIHSLARRSQKHRSGRNYHPHTRSNELGTNVSIFLPSLRRWSSGRGSWWETKGITPVYSSLSLLV